MNILIFNNLILFIFLLFAHEVNATLIDRGLYTLDTNTGLEWLDLTATQGRSYNDISPQLLEGGEFYGWRYATAAEAQGVIHESGFGVNLYTFVTNPSSEELVPLNTFTSFFGDLYPQGHLTGFAGITGELHWGLGGYELSYMGVTLNERSTCGGATPSCTANLQIFTGQNTRLATWNSNTYIGSYLVREVRVSESSTTHLFLLFGLLTFIRQKFSVKGPLWHYYSILARKL